MLIKKNKKPVLPSTNFSKNSSAGFSLMELIIYIGLVSIFITGAIMFGWDVVYGREKAYQNQVVEQESQLLMAKIGFQIRNAQQIVNLSSTSLTLDNPNGQVLISLNSQNIDMTLLGQSAQQLNSNQVKITNLQFEDLSTGDSQNLKINLTVEQTAGAFRGQTPAEVDLTQSFELNGKFNQSRRLLVDVSSVQLDAPSKNIEGISIENIGDSEIVIDQMAVYWTGTADGENLTEIQISGGTVEWSGSRGSNESLFNLDNNYSLQMADGVIDIDYFAFDSKMDGATVFIVFGMSDSSTKQLQIEFEEQGGGPPEPTSTPTLIPNPTPTGTQPTPTTAPASCSEYCNQSYGLSGSCLKSKDCGGFDEGGIYECSPPNICCCQ